MQEGGAKAVCAEEALSLLNCVTQSPYDENKCLHLLHSLRDCVLAKMLSKFLYDILIGVALHQNVYSVDSAIITHFGVAFMFQT
ncbi:hypothetical protein DEO72_LG2g5465 [Vigna unguiculata]|uniref:Cysteine alpha-hairpin motif superfamily n=1 Tax=Vigna unguiculata TaxID=3917 RepID=A0A4D6L9H5_VIGUN|nr:hypothetical protein DEO72_LG2g5465 [Vigna unguiculata]